MTNTYFYSVVTCTPHPIRGECLNLGVVAVNDTGEAGYYRFRRNYVGPLRALAPDMHANVVSSFIRDFTARFADWDETSPREDVLEPSVGTLRELASRRGGQITFSEPRAFVVDEGFDDALAQLFEQYVGRLPSTRRPALGKPEVRREIRSALRRWHVHETDIVTDPEIIGTHGATSLDLGILGAPDSHAHQRLAVAVEPISFRIESVADIQRQRDHVAWVKTDTSAQHHAPHICAVVTKPATHHQALFGTSMRMFDDLDISYVTNDEIDGLREILLESGAVAEIAR